MVYDFANSAFAAIVQATVFPAFYANVVVGNADGRGDFWWGALVSVSMVLVALSSPLLGGIADHAGVRKPFFVALTAPHWPAFLISTLPTVSHWAVFFFASSRSARVLVRCSSVRP